VYANPRQKILARRRRFRIPLHCDFRATTNLTVFERVVRVSRAMDSLWDSFNRGVVHMKHWFSHSLNRLWGTAAASAADPWRRAITARRRDGDGHVQTGEVMTAPTAAAVSRRNCWTSTATLGVAILRSRRRHNSSGRHGRWPLGYRWQAGPWVFGVEAQRRLGRLLRLQCQPVVRRHRHQTHQIELILFTGQVGLCTGNNWLGVEGPAPRSPTTSMKALRPRRLRDRRRHVNRWGGTVAHGSEYGFAPTKLGRPRSNTTTFRGDQQQPTSPGVPVGRSQQPAREHPARRSTSSRCA